jgi:AcrR family transcriptional regulator
MKGDRGRRRTKAVPEIDNVPRRPGRPVGRKGEISIASILRTAFRLSKTTPLQEVSIVVVAKALGVTPALIHYYVGGRDWLTSGTMNLFYADLLKKLPSATGNWRKDLASMSRTIFDHLISYSGVASYMVSHRRFRTFQLTAYGQRDYGMEVLERFAECILQVGCSPERAGIYTHLIMEFIISASHKTRRNMFLGENETFLREKLSKLDPGKFPSMILMNYTPASLNDETSFFGEGINLFILGLENELKNMGLRGRTRAVVLRPVSGKRKAS